jgi:alpha-tubulin suppressor-like RCC1 family protein
MRTIIIKTQVEYDALPNAFDVATIIELRSGNTFWLQVKTVPFNSTVKAYNNSMVYACDNSTVYACDNSTVKALDNSTVKACDNSTVSAHGNSVVRSCGNSMVSAHENSVVVAYGNSTVKDYREKPKPELELEKEIVDLKQQLLNRQHDIQKLKNQIIELEEQASVKG